MITPAEFKIRFPEFTDTPDATITMLLNEAVIFVNPDVWGATKGNVALGYLTAHMLALSGSGGTGGGSSGLVASESVGPLSRSYAVPTMTGGTDDYFKQNIYGQMFLRLRRTILTTPFVVPGC